MLDYRVNTFIEVCKYKNFTHAAESLNITQPAVSQHIKHLEEVYEVTLFDHIGNKIQLTKEGELLLEVFITMKHDESYLKDKLHQIQKDKLSFGATSSFIHYGVFKKLVNYIAVHDDFMMNLEIDNTKNLIEKMNEGIIDIAFIEGYFNRDGFDSFVYRSCDYIAVCSNEYHFDNSIYSISDLLSERLFVREIGASSRSILEHYLFSENYKITDFTSHMVVSESDALIEFVLGGCGIAFVYKDMVKPYLDKNLLREVKIKDFNMVHDLCFVWRKNSAFKEAYLGMIKELCKEDV